MKIEENGRFQSFRAKLEAQGYTLRRLWQALGKGEHPDLTCFVIMAMETDKPASAVHTVVVADYGEDGFALWVDTGTVNMDSDVRRIIGGEAMPKRTRYVLQYEYLGGQVGKEEWGWVDCRSGVNEVAFDTEEEARKRMNEKAETHYPSRHLRAWRVIRRTTGVSEQFIASAMARQPEAMPEAYRKGRDKANT